MPTGEVNLVRNLDSYSLNEFKTLAENSRDNQELRIRKSNHELSNTPLGFLARNFGSTHATSNAQVTQAFRHALQTDPKYRTISSRLANVLSAQMPANQPLTAAKVKSAIGMADRMLQSQEKAISLTDMAEDFKLVSKEQLPAFKSFVMDYLFTHPDVQPDLTNLGENLTPEQKRMDVKDLQPLLKQQEGAKLQTLSTILKAFYAQGGAEALEKGGYGISPSQTGGDAQKAAAITKLLAIHNGIESEPGEILNKAFDLQKAQVPKSGCLARTFNNALSNCFADQMKGAGMDKYISDLMHMKTQDVTQIVDALNAKAEMSVWEKSRVVKFAVLATGRFVSQHPDLAAQPEKMQEALGKLTGKLTELINKRISSSEDFKRAADQLSVEILLNEQDLAKNGESIFAKAAVAPKIGLALLSNPGPLGLLTNKVGALGDQCTDAQIAEAVRTEASKLIEQNAPLLKKVQDANLPDNLLAIGIKTALAMDKAISSISLGQARNEELMLEQLQGVAIALGDKSLSDAERGQILKNLTGEFAKTFPTGTEQLCRDNLPVFARLVGQLQKLAGDPSISKSTRDACMDVAMIAQALYNNLLALAPEERQMELELIPDNTGNPAGNLAANVNPLKSFPHNATSAQMFAGFKELESSEEGKEDQIKYRGMMEKLGCPDYKLIALFNSSSSLTISESTGTLTENNQGYKVISHLHNNISNMAASLKSAHENSAGYDPAQIDDFAADVYLSGLTDEQKRNLLASLKDPGVREYLEVASNYARKNEALPDNIVVPKLLTLGNNGKYFAEAAKVLQLAANKAAQQLGEPAPGQIYDPNSTKTVIDLAKSFGFDENFIGSFTAQFRKYCTPFDNDAYLVGNHLNQAQHDAVNNLFKNLKAPEAQNGINTMYGQLPDRDFRFTFTDTQGNVQRSSWTPKMLATMFAFRADSISQLLDSTGGNPTAQQLWGVLHGGQPPAGLTMDNLADKYMRSVCQQIHAAGQLIGMNLTPEVFFSSCPLKIGMDPLALVNKIVQSAHGDVKFTFSDQVGKSGMFPLPSMMGKSYENGKEHYAFGLDFIRAIMPPGAQPGPNGETGCKITVQPIEGEPVQFNQSDYKKQPDNSKGAYLAQIPAEVRKLCQSDAQLAGVGICTTQAIQGALRSVPFFYWNVTGEGLEHTALDHHISKLENGNVLVKISEKPGSLFKFDMQFEVAPDGMVSIRPESSLTLPSLEKVRAFQQANPA